MTTAWYVKDFGGYSKTNLISLSSAKLAMARKR